MTNPTTVLEEARELIDKVGWCQGWYNRRDKHGTVFAYCPLGALDARGEWACSDATKYFCKANGIINGEIGNWNDTVGRTKEEVLAAFDKAIEYSKQHSYLGLV